MYLCACVYIHMYVCITYVYITHTMHSVYKSVYTYTCIHVSEVSINSYFLFKSGIEFRLLIFYFGYLCCYK